MYAHTSHALILADFLFSFEWIWNNTIKKNDVNFFREKGKLENMYMNIHTSLILYYYFYIPLSIHGSIAF